MVVKERRKYERRPFVKPIRYFVTVSKMVKFEKIHNDSVSVDIGRGRLRMITEYPLRKGDLSRKGDLRKYNTFILEKRRQIKWARLRQASHLMIIKIHLKRVDEQQQEP